MPVNSIPNLTRIACSSCSGSASDLLSTDPSGSMSSALAGAESTSTNKDRPALINDLRLKVQETRDVIAELTEEVYDKWTSVLSNNHGIFEKLKAYVAKHLTVTVNEPRSLSKFQNQMVHILLQNSNYVYFLEKEDTLEAYGEKAANLSDMKGRLMQVVCAARHLLTEFSNSDIGAFVVENVHHSLQLKPDLNDAIRRTISAIVLKQMASVLNGIEIIE